MNKSTHKIHLLNPSRTVNKIPNNFERIFNYYDNFVIVWSENTIQILNISNLTVAANINNLRGVLDISICGHEIFILEGSRSLIRLSDSPDINSNITIFNNSNLTNLVEVPIQIEVDEEIIVNAEECFELPPIEHINLNIPIELGEPLDCGGMNKKDIINHTRKIETFEKINDIQYDDTILFKSNKINHKHTDDKHKKLKKRNSSEVKGVVEIGKQVLPDDENSQSMPSNINGNKVNPNKFLNFCEVSDIVPDPRSPDSIQKDIEIKEKILAETLNIEPVYFEKMETPIKSPEDFIPKIEFPITNELIKDLKIAPIFQKSIADTSRDHVIESKKISKDELNKMTKSEIFPSLSNSKEFDIQSLSYHSGVSSPSSSIPKVKGLPEYMNIPSLWNITIEKPDSVADNNKKESPERKSSDPNSDNSDWEIVDAQ